MKEYSVLRLAQVLRRYWLPIAAAGVVLLAGWLRASGDTVDDAFISFRCAQNFVQGSGLSFNPGTRVECFSNPLLVFMLMAPAAAAMPLDLAAHLIGLVSFFLCIFAAADLVRLSGGKPLFSIAAGCCTAMSFPLLYYSVTGLETGLFACLLVSGVWRYARKERLDLWGALIWIGVAFCRPEGAAYMAAFLLLALWRERRNPRGMLLPAALIVVIVGTGFVARHAYYGLWLPNTFYAKPPGTADLDPGSEALRSSIVYLLRYALSSGWLAPLLGAFFILRTRRPDAPLMLAALVCAGAGFAFYTGGDWFPAGRYLQPVTPALMALAALGAGELAGLFAQAARPRLFAALLLLSVAAANLFILGEFVTRRDRYPYHVMNCRDNIAAAQWMKQNLPPGISIAAFRIGAVGYFSGHEIVDLFGLADHSIAMIIARHPEFHPRSQLGNDLPEMRERLAALHPGAVLQVNRLGGGFLPRLELYGDDYVLLKKWPLGSDEEFLLYLRDDILARQGADFSPMLLPQ